MTIAATIERFIMEDNRRLVSADGDINFDPLAAQFSG
jgi:hypothetical protein